MTLPHRLRKHADYQHAYAQSAKQNSRQLTFFFSIRPDDRRSATTGARIGLTVPKAIGKAHERNRIKRRLRVLVRAHLYLLHSPIDVILHPRRTTMTCPAAALDREIADIFTRIQTAVDARNGQPFPLRPPPPPRSAKPAARKATPAAARRPQP